MYEPRTRTGHEFSDFRADRGDRVRLYSSFHARLFSTGKMILTDYGRTFLFCLVLAAVPELWYRVGTALVVTDLESLNSWSYTMIRELYWPLRLLAGLLGGMILLKAVDEGTDKILWFRETVVPFLSACQAGLRAGAAALGCVLVTTSSYLLIGGLVNTFIGLISSLETHLGSSLATVLAALVGLPVLGFTMVVAFTAYIWFYVVLVTIPVRQLVLDQPAWRILREEWNRIFSRVPDYFLWAVVLKLLLSLNSGYAVLVFSVPLAYLTYLTMFLTEARRLRGEFEESVSARS